MSFNYDIKSGRPGGGCPSTNRFAPSGDSCLSTNQAPPSSTHDQVRAGHPRLPSYLDNRFIGDFSAADYVVQSTEGIIGRAGLQTTDGTLHNRQVSNYSTAGFPSAISTLESSQNRFSVLAPSGNRSMSDSSVGSTDGFTDQSSGQGSPGGSFTAGLTAPNFNTTLFDDTSSTASSSESSVQRLPTQLVAMQAGASNRQRPILTQAHQPVHSMITSAPRQTYAVVAGSSTSSNPQQNFPHQPGPVVDHWSDSTPSTNGWAILGRPRPVLGAPTSARSVTPMVPRSMFVRHSIDEIFRARSGTSGAFQPSHILFSDPPEQRPSCAWPFDDFGQSQSIVATSRVGNSNYGGHGGIGTNQDDGLDEDLNCAIWIMRIHPKAGIPDLLDAVRNCGRVFSCWLNEAQPPRLPHSASKLVFTTRQGFERFMAQAHSYEGIRVFGQLISAQPNRSKYRENPHADQSRVIRIYGPAQYNNRAVLDVYFGRLFFYHTCDVVEGDVDPGGYRYLVWTFGSILSQAQAAKKAIESEPAMMKSMVVDYLPDPCE